MLREDRRGTEPPESTVEHQFLFRLDGLCITRVSPHQEVHHRHLYTKRENEENVIINQPVQLVRLCVTWTDLLLMRQERHQGQRSACLHTVHHRRGYVDDMKSNIPAHLKHKGILSTCNRYQFTQPVICYFTMAPSSSATASAKTRRRVRSKFWNWKIRE